MKIEFVNHASFIVEHKDLRLICDPWLEGPAFQNGWKLLSETQLSYEAFKDITHIWFSHEHPDHFSPPNLLKIPKAYREKITVLYQETTDRKVAEFCKKIGFGRQVELKEDEAYQINHEVSIVCNPYTDGDSYSLLNVAGYKILNLNDCIVDSAELAEALAEKVGNVDVLFTQFGYANKVGNTEDVAFREKASKEKLQRISYQNQFLKPKTIVPFASFIYFCHEENSYMNEGMNRIDLVHDFIQNELGTECVVMYPGDEWQPHTPHDSQASISKYLRDYESVSERGLMTGEMVSAEDLQKNGDKFVEQLLGGYPKHKGFIRKQQAHVFVNDLGQSFLLDGKSGLVKTQVQEENCDISLSSEALNYAFTELWGGDTLNVNARFQIPKNGNYHKFRPFSVVASHLNRKEPLPIPSIPRRVMNRVKRLINPKG